MRELRTDSEKPRKRPSLSQKSSEDRLFKEFCSRHDTLCYLLSLYSDISRHLKLSFTDCSIDIATIKRRYAGEGLGFATKTLPKLFNSLLNYLETGESSYPGWKLDPGRNHPAFMRQLFRRIYSGVSEDDKVIYVQHLYQFCVAFKKLKGPYRTSTLRKELWSFVETDTELRYLDLFNEANKPILETARKIVKTVLKGLDPDEQVRDFVPRPGPGATNTPTRNHERFCPHVMYKTINEVFPYEEWFYTPHPWDLVDRRSDFIQLIKAEKPTSRFKFVPKTFSKPRGICIEQLETQWLQQAVKSALYKRIEKHPLTRGKVNFSDQSINGALALSSSKTKELATIDMKEASDRVSRDLVSYLFQDNRRLHEMLMALSVETIELPEEIPFVKEFPCAKFAPMGSALCFPVMSLVHFALCTAILQLSQASRTDSLSVYVYGDDILVPSHCTQAIYDWLPRFGMKLNTDKSFYRSHFRESCGVHAYHGVDITPVNIRCLPLDSAHLDSLVSLLQVEAKLFKKGYTDLACTLRRAINRVDAWRKIPLPFVSPTSPILGWIRDKEYAPTFRYIGCKERLKADHQDSASGTQGLPKTRQFKVLVIEPLLEKSPPLIDVQGYLRWLCLAAEDAKDVPGSCERLRVVHRWLPQSAF